jgi:hypothetical protein
MPKSQIFLLHWEAQGILTILFPVFEGLASRLPRPDNLVKYAESCMYSPVYRSYR